MKIKGTIYSDKSMKDLKESIEGIVNRMEEVTKRQEEVNNKPLLRAAWDFMKRPLWRVSAKD